MSRFGSNVKRAFRVLCEKGKFVPAIETPRFVSFVRKETDEVFTYVFVTDGRAGGADLTVDLWIAPPHSPDHGLDSLTIGYKLNIGREYEVDDLFFEQCQLRIVRLLPHLQELCAATVDELRSPSFSNKRIPIYRLERRTYCQWKQFAAEGLEIYSHVFESGKKVAENGIPHSELEEACRAAAQDSCLNARIDPDALAFFENHSEWLASSMASYVHVESLVEFG